VFLAARIPVQAWRLLVQFRLGLCDFAIRLGKYDSLPFYRRTCRLRKAFHSFSAVEDEVHFLCECPALDDLRLSLFQALLPPIENDAQQLASLRSPHGPTAQSLFHFIMNEGLQLNAYAVFQFLRSGLMRRQACHRALDCTAHSTLPPRSDVALWKEMESAFYGCEAHVAPALRADRSFNDLFRPGLTDRVSLLEQAAHSFVRRHPFRIDVSFLQLGSRRALSSLVARELMLSS